MWALVKLWAIELLVLALAAGALMLAAKWDQAESSEIRAAWSYRT